MSLSDEEKEILAGLYRYLDSGMTEKDKRIDSVLREFHSISRMMCLYDVWDEYSNLWFDALGCAIEQAGQD